MFRATADEQSGGALIFRGMALGGSTDVWLPMKMQPYAIPRLTGTILNDRMAGWIAIYGRLASGVNS